MHAQLGEYLRHPLDDVEAGDAAAKDRSAARDERWQAAFRDVEMIEQLLERKVAEFLDLVFVDPADAVVGRELVENFAGLTEGVCDGAIEIEDQCSVLHGDGGLVLGMSFRRAGGWDGCLLQGWWFLLQSNARALRRQSLPRCRYRVPVRRSRARNPAFCRRFQRLRAERG